MTESAEIIHGAQVVGAPDTSSIINSDPITEQPGMPDPIQFRHPELDAKLGIGEHAPDTQAPPNTPAPQEAAEQNVQSEPVSMTMASIPDQPPAQPKKRKARAPVVEEEPEEEEEAEEDEEKEPLSKKELKKITILKNKLRLYQKHYPKVVGDIFNAFQESEDIEELEEAVETAQRAVSSENSEGFVKTAFFNGALPIFENTAASLDFHIKGLSRVMQQDPQMAPVVDSILTEMMIDYSEWVYVPAVYRLGACIIVAGNKLHTQYDELYKLGFITKEQINDPDAALLGLSKLKAAERAKLAEINGAGSSTLPKKHGKSAKETMKEYGE